jgi:hypothetical protein
LAIKFDASGGGELTIQAGFQPEFGQSGWFK